MIKKAEGVLCTRTFIYSPHIGGSMIDQRIDTTQVQLDEPMSFIGVHLQECE